MVIGGFVVFSVVLLADSNDSTPLGGGPPLGSTEPSLTDNVHFPPVPFSFDLGYENEVARCEVLTGSGTAPRQNVLVLLVFSDDGSVHFGDILGFRGNRWRAEVKIGTEDDAGRTFTVAVYEVPAEIAERWATEGIVPSEPDEPLDEVTVVRTDESEPC
jgi:hypothetical protein